MIRLRTCALLVAVVCGPAAAQEPRPFPPPAAERMVTLEARWLAMPVGFCDRHLPAGAGSVLTEKEFIAFAADWTGAPITDAQVAPLMSVPSGREASGCRGCHYDGWFALDKVAKVLSKRVGLGAQMTFSPPDVRPNTT